MLKLKNLIENDDIVSELLKNYDFKDVEYGFYRSSSNVVYWVNGDGKMYFLRYTTTDERTNISIQEEVKYIIYLRNHNISANKPVRTKSGTYVIQKDNYLAVLFEEVPGERLDDIELNSNIVTEWGRKLGRMHNLSGDLSASTQFINCMRLDYNEKFEWISSVLDKKKDLELLKEADWLEESFNDLIKTKDNYGLCHYDFELDNIYYDKNIQLFSIIDFDDSMYHFFAIDYERVMMNIEEELPIEMQSWVKGEFQKGYLEYNTIPDPEIINLAREFIILLGYAKLTYSLNYPPEHMPDWMDEVIDKLNNAIREKRDWLMERICEKKTI